MADRTYNEGEINALMERAAQLQASVDQRPDIGLTLSELEQVAAEAGIEPSFLRTAVREAESGVGLRNVHGQTATQIFVERTVEGTLTEDEWHDVVLLLRKQFSSEKTAAFDSSPIHNQGVIEQLGTSREWRHSTMSGIATTISIRSVDDVQHIRMQRQIGLMGPRAEAVGYGFLLSLVLGLIVGGAVAGSVLVFLISLVTSFLIIAPTYDLIDRRWRAKKLAELNHVADEIARIIHNDADKVVEAEGEQAASPEISLDELPEQAIAELPSATRDRTHS